METWYRFMISHLHKAARLSTIVGFKYLTQTRTIKCSAEDAILDRLCLNSVSIKLFNHTIE